MSAEKVNENDFLSRLLPGPASSLKKMHAHSAMKDTFTLDKAPIGTPLEVVGVNAADAPESWDVWLEEIGFTAGEPCMVMQRAALGGDPIAVRIGVSTFALRLVEAACVTVRRRAH